jgi:hypothetical protein
MPGIDTARQANPLPECRTPRVLSSLRPFDGSNEQVQVLDHNRHDTPPSLRRIDGRDQFASYFASINQGLDLPFESAGRQNSERVVDVGPLFPVPIEDAGLETEGSNSCEFMDPTFEFASTVRLAGDGNDHGSLLGLQIL